MRKKKSNIARKRKSSIGTDPGRNLKRQRAEVVPGSGCKVQAAEKLAFRYDGRCSYDELSAIGNPSFECQFCGALKWKSERPGMCCSGGKVRIPKLEPLPEPLYSLIMGFSAESKHFLSNIRRYNNCFQMTSFGASSVVAFRGGFSSTFKVQGQVYHTVGSLLAPQGEDPKFLQIYFMGNQEMEAKER